MRYPSYKGHCHRSAEKMHLSSKASVVTAAFTSFAALSMIAPYILHQARRWYSAQSRARIRAVVRCVALLCWSCAKAECPLPNSFRTTWQRGVYWTILDPSGRQYAMCFAALAFICGRMMELFPQPTLLAPCSPAGSRTTHRCAVRGGSSIYRCSTAM